MCAFLFALQSAGVGKTGISLSRCARKLSRLAPWHKPRPVALRYRPRAEALGSRSGNLEESRGQSVTTWISRSVGRRRAVSANAVRMIAAVASSVAATVTSTP
jgi:hypothetical protein